MSQIIRMKKILLYVNCETNLYVKAIQAWIICNIMVIMSFATVFFLSIKYDNAL